MKNKFSAISEGIILLLHNALPMLMQNFWTFIDNPEHPLIAMDNRLRVSMNVHGRPKNGVLLHCFLARPIKRGLNPNG